ncbi:DUF2797 domain-containing protein [Croceimicrobium sp.]|uniref:DUF2797 domain-containing protein n=1 Tax=Croceimicrobium sp. TaxID=2828340 RepID=UPI003BAD9A47
MELTLTLEKMPAWLNDEGQATYILKADQDFIQLQRLLGQQITIEFVNEKYCANCGNRFEQLYRMGFCQNCFFTSPQAGESIIRPELSRAHEGIEDRDLEFEKSYQLQPHLVYLANSGDIKVGVTRMGQRPNRWIDQGASEAIVFAETKNRYQAGQIEVAMKSHLGDKTPWQRMLKNEIPEFNLLEEKQNLKSKLEGDLAQFYSSDDQIWKIDYPVLEYPSKVKSVNLDKEPQIEAVLKGIRGQYLIFEGGRVLNVRANTGYRVKLSFA